MSLDDFLFDKRTVQRNIETGKLDAARYQQMLDALPDLSGSLWRRPEVVTAPQSPPQRPDTARPEPSAPVQLQPAPAV